MVDKKDYRRWTLQSRRMVLSKTSGAEKRGDGGYWTMVEHNEGHNHIFEVSRPRRNSEYKLYKDTGIHVII